MISSISVALQPINLHDVVTVDLENNFVYTQTHKCFYHRHTKKVMYLHVMSVYIEIV